MQHIISFLTNNPSSILILNDGIATFNAEKNTIHHNVMGISFNLSEVKDFKWDNENEFSFSTDEMNWWGQLANVIKKDSLNWWETTRNRG